MSQGCGSFAVSRVLVWRLGYLRGSRRVRAWVRLPFLTVLKCEIGTRGREASVEGYAVDGLAASGEPAGLAADRGLAELEAAGNAVAPGLGPLVVRVAVMYEGAAGAVLLDDMEHLAVEESRKIGLGALQLAMDAQADAEVPLPGLTGADGERRGGRGGAPAPGGAVVGGGGGGAEAAARRGGGGGGG